MFIFLPDSPVTARGLTLREKRIAVDRIRENQTGVENKHLKPYQILEAFMDYKLYMFFILGVVCEWLHEAISQTLLTEFDRQHSQWRDFKFWHYHYPRVRVFNIGDNADAGMLCPTAQRCLTRFTHYTARKLDSLRCSNRSFDPSMRVHERPFRKSPLRIRSNLSHS